ncbi:MAG TPA: HAMP domain-containing sensor histidine kinase [Acidimicrobiia bacterium]|nr:HAMP domain-containing sensor histidine kinase [Acidimicrobiia bacterium]
MSRRRQFFRSIRFRLSLLYSAVVFGLGGLLLALVYVAIRWQLTTQTETRLILRGRQMQLGQYRLVLDPRFEEAEVRTLESIFNQYVLERLALYTLIGLGLLFLISLGVGWVLAGRALAPVDRITQVAREIEASDLSRRIGLIGPNDELTRLGSTFDSMLDRLEGAFGAQRSFLADTSHDLRTPLSVIRSNVEVTLDDPDSSLEEWKATGEIIARNAERMSAMIEGLLAAARFQAGQATMVQVDLSALVRTAVEDHRAASNDLGVGLTEIAGEAEVHGDLVSLSRALSNLVDNSLKASTPGAKVEVGSGRSGDWAYLAVADEGSGFESSFVTSGFGLGIVEHVAQMHGGSFQIYSEPGQGATTIVWLPIGTNGDAPQHDPLRHRTGRIETASDR